MKKYLIVLLAVFLYGGCVRFPVDQTLQEPGIDTPMVAQASQELSIDTPVVDQTSQEPSIDTSVQNNTQKYIQVSCEIHNQIMIKEKIKTVSYDNLYGIIDGVMVDKKPDKKPYDGPIGIGVWNYISPFKFPYWELRKEYFPNCREVYGPSCIPLTNYDTYVCEECNNEKDKYMEIARLLEDYYWFMYKDSTVSTVRNKDELVALR